MVVGIKSESGLESDSIPVHNNNIIIIVITRPKPAYGRQGLAGLWRQDTDEMSTFLGVLNVALRACGAQCVFKPTWDP